jgi:hypothetical protein
VRLAGKPAAQADQGHDARLGKEIPGPRGKHLLVAVDRGAIAPDGPRPVRLQGHQSRRHRQPAGDIAFDEEPCSTPATVPGIISLQREGASFAPAKEAVDAKVADRLKRKMDDGNRDAGGSGENIIHPANHNFCAVRITG